MSNLSREAAMLLLLCGPILAAPAPFLRGAARSPAERLEEVLTRLRTKGEAYIPELSATVTVEGFRGRTLLGVTIRNTKGRRPWVMRARECEMKLNGSSLLLHTRRGEAEWGDSSARWWDDYTLELAWPTPPGDRPPFRVLENETLGSNW
jgi:hypothetical protein